MYPEYKDVTGKYRVPKLSAGKPQLRYYPNIAKGDKKLDRSFGLPLDLNSNDFTPIVDDILSSFESHIVDIQPHLFNNYLIQYAKDQKKNVIYYMYTGEQQISISFR